MVSTPKRAKKIAKKPARAATKRPDFDKARKAVDKLIDENIDWLKSMAKR